MSVVSIDIQPETDTLNLFTGENMIPNAAFTLKGHVQLTLLRPIQVRQITIQLKGTVRNIISNDILRQTEPLLDENDVQLWPVAVLHSNSTIPLVDRVTRRALNAALGYASASQTIIRESVHLFDNSTSSPVSLEAGVTRWPFELVINNVDQLPPSMLLPRHSITYELSAKLRLASFREIAKLTYWNARSSASFSFLTSTSSKSSRRFSRSSSSSTSSVSSSQQQQSVSALQERPKLFAKQKQKLLRIIKPIHVFCHGHGSLQILEFQQRIRYRGCRENHLRYEVSMAKYLCIQKKKADLVCHFFPLCDAATIASVEVCLEQTEQYPLRAGRIRESDPLPAEILVSKSSRPISVKHIIDPERDEISNLPLSIRIDSPHIGQDVDTHSLKITHKIRVIVHFANDQVRKMSLSFPVVIGTVPINSGGVTIPAVVQQDMYEWEHGNDDDWIDIIGADQTQRYSDNNGDDHLRGFEKLPTYYEVLHEGAPPAAFIDDDLSHHPSPII
ncbi:hypothetical protein BJV82DRAFT_587637 [Fennellomyces sp. T-0311]|nr:hypothetical protein BJV82DRAFT_587637 [Fennellomyces sp. T-0311]